MNCTQNEKINQVTEGTLIVGIDIASETHYARAFDWRGIELGKVIKFENELSGFEKFELWIETLKKQHNKQSVILGAEPTGHYWFTLADYVAKKKIELVLVNPYHVKRSKELDDNSPTKTDKKDPKTIANLVKDGRYMYPYIPEGIYADLRIAVNTRHSVIKELNSIKNRIERWLKIYFPEFKTVFKDPYGIASLEILKLVPLPSDLNQLEGTEINSLWRAKKIRAVGLKRALKLKTVAGKSIGRCGGQMARIEIKMILEDYERKQSQLSKLEEFVEELCLQIPEVEKILSIKGLGITSVAGFFAEVGDIRRFDSPKQIQKYAGLAIKENSSGKHRGKSGISKRGRKRLRAILFQVIMPLVGHNEAFKELHHYYITRNDNPLKKKQSLIALCCKLIRVIFGIATKGFEYDSKKLLDDIKRPSDLQVA